MPLKDRERKILEQINSFKKPAREVVKSQTPITTQKKVETSAEQKKVMMLSILNNEKLKAGERLERIYKILGDEK
jgi:hypothetical protein